MSIETRCPACGKKLKAPDKAAGRTARCPECGTPVEIPEAIFDAEEVEDDTYELTPSRGDKRASSEVLDEPADRDNGNRRPCPVCGEMIQARARKCRYCGEVLDPELRRRVGRRSGAFDPEMLTRFRREMHGLGGFWIFIGILVILAAIATMNAARQNPLADESAAVIAMMLGLTYITLGVFTFLKQMWAVWIGLVLSYFALVLNVIRTISGLAAVGGRGGAFAGGFICGVVFGFLILIAVIVQAHRVIKWARELREAGVPLTARP